jgi:hypothetical protein
MTALTAAPRSYRTIRIRPGKATQLATKAFTVDLSSLTPTMLTTHLQHAGVDVTVLSLVHTSPQRLDAILTKRHHDFGLSLQLEIFNNSREAVRARYPHLLAAMKWVAILSNGEAIGAIIDHREGRRFGCEAVNHFGGTHRVIAEAIRVRQTVRTLTLAPTNTA